ncbi:MAG: (d)CMP kinase [Firmicutes bacterium]|nr:(d)CMP kinase [Bacillota bacterium]
MKLRIAIDGPAGAGKSTAARAVARRLGLAYLDTGAMYRAVTLAALRRKVNLHDGKELEKLAASLDLAVKSGRGGENIIYVDGEDVTEAIRTPEVNRHVSLVAKCPEVRRLMVEKQKEIGRAGNVVMDGRDIGTNVMPDAEVKIFLTASLEERARRRLEELAVKGEKLDLKQMIAEITARDKIDSERECSPLRPAEDAVHLDTTNMTVEEVVDAIVNIAAGP